MTVKINTKLTTENITKTPNTSFSNSATVPVVDNNEIKNILLSNLNGAGGGDIQYLPKVITIDTSLPPNGSQDIEGKTYSTFDRAKAYCDTVYEDNSDARFEIHLPAGVFSEKITLAKYYIIIGHNTTIDGSILYATEALSSPCIKDCIIHQRITDETQRDINVYAYFLNCDFGSTNQNLLDIHKETFILENCRIFDFIVCEHLQLYNVILKNAKTDVSKIELYHCTGNGAIRVYNDMGLVMENFECHHCNVSFVIYDNKMGSIICCDDSYAKLNIKNSITISSNMCTMDNSTLNLFRQEPDMATRTINFTGDAKVQVIRSSQIIIEGLTTSFNSTNNTWSCDETSKCPEEILGYANMATPDNRNRVKIAYSKNGGTSISHNQGEQSNNDTHVGFMDALGGSSTNPSNYEWVHLTPSPHKTYIFDNFNNFNEEEDQNIFDYTIDNKTWRGFSIKMWNDTVSINKNWSNYYSSMQDGTVDDDLENTGYRTQIAHPPAINKKRLSLNKWGADDIPATVLGIDLQDITDDDWYIMNENGKKSYENKYVNYISKFIFPVYVVPNSSLIFVNKGATDYYMAHSGDVKFPYQIIFNITASLGIFSVERTSLNLCYLNYIPQASNPDNIYCFIEGTITKNIYGNIFKCEINILNSQPSTSMPIA